MAPHNNENNFWPQVIYIKGLQCELKYALDGNRFADYADHNRGTVWRVNNRFTVLENLETGDVYWV